MISTIFKTFIFLTLAFSILGCDPPKPDQPSKTDAHSNRVPVVESQPIPEPTVVRETAPAQSVNPFYGSTYFDELLTSVYYYPQGTDDGLVGEATHLKFNHREDDIWLCGDQRRSFVPGKRVKLSITFELNRVCATNWQIH